jgi:CheY-like chemotaxis protein
VLLDIMMRRSNGIDVAVQLRQLASAARHAFAAALQAEAEECVAAAAAAAVGQAASSTCDVTDVSTTGLGTGGLASDSAGAVSKLDARRFKLPPIVAMTGNTSLANIETYKQAGFRHVLPKPFDVTGLQATLEACCSRPRTDASPTGDAVVNNP